MKQSLFFLCLIILCTFFLTSADLIKIGPYAGYFMTRDADFKQIYKEGDLIFGGRLGVKLWKGFYFCLSYSHMETASKTTFSEEITVLTLNPATFSLRYYSKFGFFQPYLGLGYTFLRFKEDSDLGRVRGNGKNFSYEGGMELKLSTNIGLDLGIKYDRIVVNPTGFDINLGGLQAGLSLILTF